VETGRTRGPSLADPQLERFYRQNFAVIRAKCARMLGEREEAADVAQETFVRMCESGVVHEPPEARARWIYRASTRLAIDRLRRRRLGVERRGEGGGAEVEAPGRPADETLAARQELAALAAEVPEEELEVAILCRVDGLTQPEAAEVCDRSERTVRRLLARFDRRLARRDGRSP
jgi:RNA polymerase sigma-70 factor (ECF subfamily)